MEQNIHKKFTERQNELRLYIIGFILDSHRPFRLDDDMGQALERLNMTREEYGDITACLLEKDGMVIDEERNVNFIYPVSALATSHEVTLADGRSFTACPISSSSRNGRWLSRMKPMM